MVLPPAATARFGTGSSDIGLFYFLDTGSIVYVGPYKIANPHFPTRHLLCGDKEAYNIVRGNGDIPNDKSINAENEDGSPASSVLTPITMSLTLQSSVIIFNRALFLESLAQTLMIKKASPEASRVDRCRFVALSVYALVAKVWGSEIRLML